VLVILVPPLEQIRQNFELLQAIRSAIQAIRSTIQANQSAIQANRYAIQAALILQRLQQSTVVYFISCLE